MNSFFKYLWQAIVPPDVAVLKRRFELLVWAFLLSLSFYPGTWGVLAWFSLVRPCAVIARLERKAAFRSAYFFSFFFNLFTIYWVAMVSPPGMVAAVVIVSFYYTAAFVIFRRLFLLRPLYGISAFPFLWVGIEFFRTLFETAFPWSDLGYSQSFFLYILQIVSIFSVHGLSLIIVGVNMLVWQVLRSELSVERRLTAGLISVAVILLLIGLGWAMVPAITVDGKYRVAILQGAIPIDVKWGTDTEAYNYQLHDSLARAVADTETKLIVWPETAAPCYPKLEEDCRATLGEIAIGTGTYHLIGGLNLRREGEREKYYNSCFQFSPSGAIEADYDKMKLVPFAEHVPYQDYVPFLKEEFLRKYLTFLDQYEVQWWSDFYPGDSLRLFALPDANYGVLICFESTFPEFVRSMVNEGSEFIVGITNDTWFEGSLGKHMHSRMFITRAVENRIWMVRSANSGLSYVVDDYGQIRTALPDGVIAAEAGAVRLREGKSVFTRYGDIAGKFSFLITIVAAAIFMVRWLVVRVQGFVR